MKKILFVIVFLLLLFNFEWSCKEKYQKAYEDAYRGYSSTDVEKLKKANENFSKAIYYAFLALNGKYEALMAMGLQLKDKNMYLEAAKSFEEAHKILPREEKPLYEMGNSYMNYALSSAETEKKEFLLKAKENYDVAYSIDPKDSALNVALGRYYGYIEGNIDQGIHYFSVAIDEEPMDFGARLSLGTLYLKQKQYAKALEQYQFVAQKAPKNSKYYALSLENVKQLGQYIK